MAAEHLPWLLATEAAGRGQVEMPSIVAGFLAGLLLCLSILFIWLDWTGRIYRAAVTSDLPTHEG